MTSPHGRGQVLSLAEMQATHATLRKMGRYLQPLSEQQAKSERDRPAKGPVHVVRTSWSHANIKAASVLQAVEQTIDNLADGRPIGYDAFDVADVDVEWVSHRHGAASDAVEVPGSASEQYAAMMQDVNSDTVVLFTGGVAGIATNAPASRPFLAALSRLSGARCLNLKRRLAPAYSFPAPVVDVLVAYLLLLSPPAGAFHAPVSPSNIVFAGTSQGTSTILAAVQVLLQHPSLAPPPGGILALSLAPEPIPNLPSWHANRDNDIFPGDDSPLALPDFPPCTIWPTNPPRDHPIAYKEMLSHPLLAVSLIPDWTGAPPVYTTIGSGERYIDGARLLVDNIRRTGGPVVLDEWDGCGHDFPFFFPVWWQSRTVLERAAEMVRAWVKGLGGRSERWLWTVDGETRPLNLLGMEVIEREKARALLEEKMKGMRPWTGGREKGKL